ncbi:MAG: hypothetical protein LBQ54_10300 [Planctomycetaceae bacterium]|nr:hypothetical protein [Planctomycetaceae bacterium]
MERSDYEATAMQRHVAPLPIVAGIRKRKNGKRMTMNADRLEETGRLLPAGASRSLVAGVHRRNNVFNGGLKSTAYCLKPPPGGRMERSDHEATAMQRHVAARRGFPAKIFYLVANREPNKVSVSLPGSNALALAAGGVAAAGIH